MTTNLVMTDLEDAIVERLETRSELTKRAFASSSPLVDVSQFPNLPLVFVSVTSEDYSDEKQPLGGKLQRKVAVTVEIAILATSIRARGDSPGVHEIAAIVKDVLMGWRSMTLAGMDRPMVYGSGNQFDNDEEAKIIAWLQTWSTMTIVKEV